MVIVGVFMKYQHTSEAVLLLLLLFVFFVPAGFSAWTTSYGEISSDKYQVKQKKGGRQCYTLNFTEGDDLVVKPANTTRVTLGSATGSLLHLGLLGHYSDFSQVSPSPHTFIVTLLGTFAGAIGYLSYQQTHNSGGPLTIDQLNHLTLTGLSFNVDMHVEVELIDNSRNNSVKFRSRIEKKYSDGTPKTILVTVTFLSANTDVVLEFEVLVPGSQQLVDISLPDESIGDPDRDDNEDPDAGCCGFGLSGCLSASAGYVISFCSGSQSSETRPASSSKDGGYNTFRAIPQIEMNYPLKMAIGSIVLLSAPLISGY